MTELDKVKSDLELLRAITNSYSQANKQYVDVIDALRIEVEQLKKENEYGNKADIDAAYAGGVVEGERRTLQRVKKLLNSPKAYKRAEKEPENNGCEGEQ
jgi:FtsZ-binding cell division protein ZapB